MRYFVQTPTVDMMLELFAFRNQMLFSAPPEPPEGLLLKGERGGEGKGRKRDLPDQCQTAIYTRLHDLNHYDVDTGT